MSLKATLYQNRFRKKLKKGFAGYPIATITYYGPDNQRASKVAVGIIQEEGDDDVAFIERWYSELEDVRTNSEILKGIIDFISSHSVKSVVATDGILGCPHEEGTDYPDGQKCPACTFWAIRDRFTGNIIH